MLIKRLRDCLQFIAGDNSQLREIVNPHTAKVGLTYSLAWAQVLPGEQTTPHTLDCSEVYYILKGSGVMHIDEEKRTVQRSDTIFIPPHAIQFIKNTGHQPLEFLCIVSPPWQPDKEHIIAQ
ncbi:hypothetical protein AMJ87_11800 [candidate division WOR_3 bacterium SM23_60]|uniref:Cupin type-2 domain-containing protein n=1 Tax=candidate division WOR_3 bacterium SM23_60 TaxID=1703780 RepID=A0A0S8G716_UNCW3|nr:MAG: hypothetical protein AMJ87_11800 [candidate division WOR_3 bacterium SM23_60]